MKCKTSLKNLRGYYVFIGDVRDLDRLHLAMRDADLVVHAALKHVESGEYNRLRLLKRIF